MREYTRNIAFIMDRKENYPFMVDACAGMVPTKEFLFWFGTDDNFIFARTDPSYCTWGFETLRGLERLCDHMLRNNLPYRIRK